MASTQFVVRLAGALPTALAVFVFVVVVVAAREASAQSPSPSAASGSASARPAAPVVVAPRRITEAVVPYPDGATGDATILVTLTVAIDGTVRDASPDLDAEPFAHLAVDAVRSWRFEPATRDGVPIAAKIRVEIAFHAPPPPPPPVSDAPASARVVPPKRAVAHVEEFEDVSVTGAREPARSVSLTRAEVRQIPGTFGDPFRAIEMMPGVTPIVSGLPFFFIRGAPPGNVGYFLDGVRVPLLFHVGAGPSVVHPGLVDRVDLYPGGYPARYGRFSGGIVAGETLPPTAVPRGEFNLRLFDAGALVELPFDGGRGTVLLGGRYSYTGALLSAVSSGTVLDYWDYQGRASYDLTPDDRISVFAFGAYDFLGEKTQTETLTLFGTSFHRVDLRYDHRLGNRGSLRLALTGGIDSSRVDQDRSVRDRLAGVRSELAYRLLPNTVLRAGTDLQLDSYDVQINTTSLAASQVRILNEFPTRTDLTMGARADVVVTLAPVLEITPGVRADFYASDGAAAVGIDPRLGMRTRLLDNVHLLSALGIAHQPPAFVVPTPGFQPGGLKGGLQRAFQESLGVEINIDTSTLATATVFHNAFYSMSDPLGVAAAQTSGCPPGAFPTDTLGGDRGNQPGGNGATCGTPRFTPGTVGPDRSGGGSQAAESTNSTRTANLFEVRTDGQAYGLELFLKRRLTKKLGGFLSYTLSRSTRTYGGQRYIAAFDRTHVINAALAFDLGRNWRAGTRVVFYTGLPKAYDPTDPTSTRLPAFVRFDLRLEKRWQLGRTTWLSVVAEWMNATLSKEAIATQCTLSGCESRTIGPVTIPSLGLEGGF